MFERTQVGIDEADRVVDFVGDAGGQLADRRHLLGLQQLLLCFLDLVQQRGQLGLLAFQLSVGLFEGAGPFGDQGFQLFLMFEELFFRVVPFADVLQGLDGADDSAVGIADRRGAACRRPRFPAR